MFIDSNKHLWGIQPRASLSSGGCKLSSRSLCSSVSQPKSPTQVIQGNRQKNGSSGSLSELPSQACGVGCRKTWYSGYGFSDYDYSGCCCCCFGPGNSNAVRKCKVLARKVSPSCMDDMTRKQSYILGFEIK